MTPYNLTGYSRKGFIHDMKIKMADFQELPLNEEDFPLHKYIEKTQSPRPKVYLLTRIVCLLLRNFALFSSPVPCGSGAFQMSTRPSSASTLGGGRAISETLQ